MNRLYTKNQRLADVLALIQVLALDKKTHRSEDGLQIELQGKPRSSASWMGVAKEHSEFFRVHEGRVNPISLVARHVTPENEYDERSLDNAFVQTLMRTAIDMHDREEKRKDRWFQIFQTLVSGVIGGLIALLVNFLTGLLRH